MEEVDDWGCGVVDIGAGIEDGEFMGSLSRGDLAVVGMMEREI